MPLYSQKVFNLSIDEPASAVYSRAKDYFNSLGSGAVLRCIKPGLRYLVGTVLPPYERAK